VSDGTRALNFTYTGSDLATASDPLNHVTSYSYDGSGQLLSWMRPRGNVPYVQTYANGRVASQTEKPAALTDNTTAFNFNTNTGETTLTDPTGKQRVHAHNSTGLATRFTDETDKSVLMTYDANARRDSVMDRLGRKTLLAYHLPSGKVASMVEPDGATTAMTYKPRALANGLVFYDLVKITRADGTSRLFTHDARGNLVTAIDELGKKTAFSYDAHGCGLTSTNPTGGVDTFVYDAKENLASSADTDTGTTTYTYDAFSRLTRVTHPDATRIDIAYDAADRIASITDERNSTYGYTYDENDNVTAVTDPASQTTQFAYDALDRVTQLTNRLGKASASEFDARDWLAGVTDENNNTITIARDSRQRLASVANAAGKTTSFGYNDEAELASITDPLGHLSSFTRNRRGNVTAVSDALGHTWQFYRDVLQRVTKLIDPIGRAIEMGYDKRGLLVGASRDGIGGATYTRDAAGRLLKLSDPNHAVWAFTYSPAGRVTASKDPLGRVTGYSYDPRGRLANTTLPDGGSCAIARDGASNVTQLDYSGGPSLQYAYDTLNRLTAATGVTLSRDAEGRITDSVQGAIHFSATYDDAGRLTSVSYNNNAFVVTYGYDTRNRLVSVSDNAAAGANSVTLLYDDADRLTGITRSSGVNATFTYDAADRLTRIQDGAFLDLKYSLKADGDIAAVDFSAPLVPAVTPEAQSFVFDAGSQVKSPGFTYDARGRLTAMPGHTFAWDGASRLVTMDGVALGYDAFGDMISRGTTRYFYHHAIGLHPLVAERAGSDFQRYYVWTPGGALVWSVDAVSGAASFYHFDRVGSTLALTNGAGALTDSYSYTPYGELRGHEATAGNTPSTQPFTFVGRFGIRREGAFYQMRARYYDPLTARFLSRDPAPPSLTDVRGHDPYLYALGNPTRYIDVNGAKPLDDPMGFNSRIENSKAFALAVLLVADPPLRQETLDYLKWAVSRNDYREAIAAANVVNVGPLDSADRFPLLATAGSGPLTDLFKGVADSTNGSAFEPSEGLTREQFDALEPGPFGWGTPESNYLETSYTYDFGWKSVKAGKEAVGVALANSGCGQESAFQMCTSGEQCPGLADDCPSTGDICVGFDACAQLAQELAGKLQVSASANEPDGILDLSKARNGYFEKRPKKSKKAR
jgi:RHS repeat-associated protein